MNMTDEAADLDVTNAHALQTEGSARILDVREDDEWDAGHVPGSVHIPLATLGGRLGEVTKGQTWLVICRSGSRSSRAAEVLRSSGVDARNVTGGVRAWAQAGLPFETAQGAPGLVI